MICVEEWVLFFWLIVACFLSGYIGYTTRCYKGESEE